MRTEQIEVGAVILASGFELYDAHLSGEYGLGRYPNVVTSQQYERIPPKRREKPRQQTEFHPLAEPINPGHRNEPPERAAEGA